MDKNMAAFLRDDAFTIEIKFQASQNPDRRYSYISLDKSIQVGDMVIVPFQKQNEPERFSVVEVMAVHDDLQIPPNDPIEFKYVVGKVDLAAFKLLKEQNLELAQTLGKAYRRDMRRQFAQSLLGGLPQADADAIRQILGPVKTVVDNIVDDAPVKAPKRAKNAAKADAGQGIPAQAPQTVPAAPWPFDTGSKP